MVDPIFSYPGNLFLKTKAYFIFGLECLIEIVEILFKKKVMVTVRASHPCDMEHLTIIDNFTQRSTADLPSGLHC